jgi:hypothetical protein
MEKTILARLSLQYAQTLSRSRPFFGLTITGLIAALVMAIGYLNDVPWYWVAVGTPFAGLCTFVMLNWKSGLAKYEHDSVSGKKIKNLSLENPENINIKLPYQI